MSLLGRLLGTEEDKKDDCQCDMQIEDVESNED